MGRLTKKLLLCLLLSLSLNSKAIANEPWVNWINYCLGGSGKGTLTCDFGATTLLVGAVYKLGSSAELMGDLYAASYGLGLLFYEKIPADERPYIHLYGVLAYYQFEKLAPYDDPEQGNIRSSQFNATLAASISMVHLFNKHFSDGDHQNNFSLMHFPGGDLGIRYETRFW